RERGARRPVTIHGLLLLLDPPAAKIPAIWHDRLGAVLPGDCARRIQRRRRGSSLAQVVRRTNAGVSSLSERTPHCCIAACNSVLRSSSTRSTPGWPKAPRPQR